MAVTRNGIYLDLRATGFDGFADMLRELPQQMRREILLPSVATLAATGARLARANLRRVLPKRDNTKTRWQTPTGALANSLGSKFMPLGRMKNPDVVFALYGSRVQFTATMSVRRKVASLVNFGLGKRAFGPVGLGRVSTRNRRAIGQYTPIAVKPYKYAHFVERGHRRGRGPVDARPYPFMAPTRRDLDPQVSSIIRERMRTVFPSVVGRMKNRYLRKARNAGVPV